MPNNPAEPLVELKKEFLDTLETHTLKYVTSDHCLQTSNAGWEAFNSFGNNIFKTLNQHPLFNFTKCLISLDLYPHANNPQWPPANKEDFDFIDPDYGMLLLSFFEFDTDKRKDSIKSRFYRLLAKGETDVLIQEAINDLLNGKNTVSYHYEKIKQAIESQNENTESRILKLNMIYRALAEEFDIRDIIVTTSVVKMPFSIQVNGVITAFTIAFYHEKKNIFTEFDFERFEEITKHISQCLKFDKSQQSIKYLNKKMQKQQKRKEQLLEARRHIDCALNDLNLDEEQVSKQVLKARDRILAILYPMLYLPEPQAAKAKYTPYQDNPLEFLEENFPQCLEFFDADVDILFQDQLSHFDEKLKNAVRNQIRKLLAKNLPYKNRQLKPFNEIVKPAKVKNDMIYNQLSGNDIQMIKQLSVIINERENPTVNRKSYKSKK